MRGIKNSERDRPRPKMGAGSEAALNVWKEKAKDKRTWKNIMIKLGII